MDRSQILAHLQAHPSPKVKIAIVDIDGVLRGKVVHRDKFLGIVDKGFGFCDVVFGWDMADMSYDNVSITGWHTGYPDAQAQVDLTTFRQIPWEDELPFFLGDFVGPTGAPLPACPRNLFKQVIARAHDAGFAPKFSQEFEWFTFAENPQSLAEKDFRDPTPMTPGMFGYSILRSSYKQSFFSDLFDELLAFDIPLEGLHTETGPGVYEAAIQYGDALEAADRAVLFKTAVKEIAMRHGLTSTFMAKWRSDLPGCSGHVHQSLWDETSKKNVFADADSDTGMSALMESYIAGQLHCLPHILPMMAPTINSYKRLVEGAWAPTTLTWGIDNRTTALRALLPSSSATRLETRVCGSDVNPYLAMAACLASGLYGIEKGLKLEQPAVVGNGYEVKEYGVLPHSLEAATHAMKHSEIARSLFGDGFVDHFTASREWEVRAYAQAVTDWEMRRYFEII
ncbi:glutamine synthetase family protein [Pontibacter sp. G13]|uniref:glutamine synthetase family protein n=1 Tax=Pontibacter sp. G13 TaxID=3074898 RepID=UPI002889123E|nr:glutamine synthetase family protein [Pontibacter sp. G13]WNJ17987.1 glutamine synthetase family protein [Pontibacter sp. G13]